MSSLNKTQKKRRCQCTPKCTKKPLKNHPFCITHALKCDRHSPTSGYEPNYNPKKFNTQHVRKIHNCFAYALDHIDLRPNKKKNNTAKFHQPGISSGFPSWNEIDGKRCPDLLSRIFADVSETKVATFTEKCAPNHSKIAIVVDPKNDYHFYRQDSNKYWSHKPGSTEVTNKDADGIRIYDPSLANRNYFPESTNYTHFCSYLCIPRNKKHHTTRRGGGIRKTKKLKRKHI